MEKSAYMNGAQDCFAVLKSIKESLDQRPGQSTADYFMKRDRTIKKIVGLAGDLSPYAEGVIGILAEYLVDEALYSGLNEIDDTWVPQTTMSDSEREIARLLFAGDVGDLEDYKSSLAIVRRSA